jgi:hypothetical protein
MKLMSAIGMLTVSAAMLVSSTFAWFSMNKTVTAETITMNVKSESTYLLIGEGDNDTASEIQAAPSTALTWDTDGALYPSAPVQNATEAAYIAATNPTGSGKTTAGAAIATGGQIINSKTKAADFKNWYTADATAVTAAAIKTDSARQLAGFNDYVFIKTVYLTVAAGANDANDLTVTADFTQTGNGGDAAAARVLVASTNDNTETIAVLSSASPSATVNNATVSDDGVVAIDLYFYYDGNATPIYTNNRANLTGTTVDLTFDVTPIAG